MDKLSHPPHSPNAWEPRFQVLTNTDQQVTMTVPAKTTDAEVVVTAATFQATKILNEIHAPGVTDERRKKGENEIDALRRLGLAMRGRSIPRDVAYGRGTSYGVNYRLEKLKAGNEIALTGNALNLVMDGLSTILRRNLDTDGRASEMLTRTKAETDKHKKARGEEEDRRAELTSTFEVADIDFEREDSDDF